MLRTFNRNTKNINKYTIFHLKVTINVLKGDQQIIHVLHYSCIESVLEWRNALCGDQADFKLCRKLHF